MAQVEIVAAREDRERAQALAKYLEARGLWVRGEVSKPSLYPITPDVVVVVLWSKDAAFSTERMTLERRAFEAWAAERLVLARLDVHAAAVGLRDLPAIDLWKTVELVGFEAIAKAVRETLARRTPTDGGPDEAPDGPSDQGRGGPPEPERGGPPAQAPAPPPASEALPTSAPESRSTGGWLAIAGGLGAVAIALLVVFTLTLTSGAVRYGAYATVLVTVVAVFAALAVGSRRRVDRPSATEKRAAEPPPPPAPAAPAPEAPPLPTGAYLFVSYAHRDRDRVASVIEATREVGREVWTDQHLHGGLGWAGEIVKAMKASEGVLVCCTVGAFESDHVKREVYLAARFDKQILPVFLEAVEPPDDFLYFFADRQWLKVDQAGPDELRAQLAEALA